MLTWLFMLFVLFAPPAAYGFDYQGAGARYGVSPHVLEAISVVESSRNPLAVGVNRNKSVDLGHMQVNSDWNGKSGIEWNKLTDSEYCTYVGAWILAKELQRYNGNLWDAVAAYHIGKSPEDWEREAAQADGRKKELALWKAARGRWYANAVYGALKKIQGRDAGGRQEMRQERPGGRLADVQRPGKEITRFSGPAYVPSPFGSANLR